MSSVSAAAYLDVLQDLMARVSASQAPLVDKAAALIAEAITAGGVLQAFGSGHSEAFALELSGRAGGLVAANRIELRDLVLRGGAEPDVLTDPLLERDPGVARRLYELAAPHPRDVFVIASNSGVNGSIVEFAALVKARGHALIAVTSAEHSGRMASRHPSGLHLADHADIVLDNGAPYGDAIIPLRDGGHVCGVSSITGALLAQQIVAEVVRRMEESGVRPPVYLSANAQGGDEHNRLLEERYDGRIRRTTR
ncbi:sugar isomerase domain-containing protein [Streptosporangium sp. CA-135522]|uniref:sugar isomerase domain-containing protein n=1 Tax=Streptosporangium sp. CA-135522 TaxID=3240072 RepID=UPI003D94EE29